jgi:murein DD-endopeptidase MepM/ murein hydrolase activator NlpD
LTFRGVFGTLIRLFLEEMPAQEAKRKSRGRRFDILVVPDGEGRAPLRFRAGWWKLWLLAAAVFFACVGFTLAVLIFTPVVMYLPIPNPALEAKYGRQLTETQERLNALVEDVSLLRDYNQQLRKALGQNNAASAVADQQTQTSSPPPTVRTARQPEELAGLDRMPSGESPVTNAGHLPVQAAGNRTGIVVQLPLLQPVSGFISQGFDPARHHFGLDIAAKQGTPVGAAGDGFVVYAGWSYDDGNVIMMSHGSGYLTVYKHNQMILKSVGTAVKRGEIVALLGSSGETSGGPHLHFEVWKDGIPQDPKTFLLTRAKIQ